MGNEEDIACFLESLVADAVQGILGVTVESGENLYAAGMDSRAGIELRNLLSDSTGLELPSAMLYENPTVDLLSSFVGGEIEKHRPAQEESFHEGCLQTAPEEEAKVVALSEDTEGVALPEAGGNDHADLQWGDSEGGPGHTVLRTLTEPSPTPIFFIAPLAVGGQRAYYNFARQFLRWTKPHPLYSLDHDTLGGPSNLRSMAAMHIEDMLSVQTHGPHVLAGQSLGGMTSLEVALQAHQRGLDVRVMLIFDSPLPWQVTPIQEGDLTDYDLLATIEDGLGTLGSEILGLGARNVAIKDTLTWRRMTVDERFQFFKEWWEKLSGNMMEMSEVKDFIRRWAAANKYGVGADDVRLHSYDACLQEDSTVLYLRATSPGALSTFDDSNHEEHGTVWVSHSKTVEIIDIPGNHFTLLSQDEEDMEVMLDSLKVTLSPCGIGEQNALQTDGPSITAANLHEADQAFSFLRHTGVPYFDSLKTVQASYPGSKPGQGTGPIFHPLDAMGPRIECLNCKCHQPFVAPIVFLHDGTGAVPAGLKEAGRRMHSRSVYSVEMPASAASQLLAGGIGTQGASIMAQWASIYADIFAKEFGPMGNFVLAGPGFGGRLAWEISLKLAAMLDIDAAPPVMLLPEPLSFSLANEASKPWFRLWPLVARQAAKVLPADTGSAPDRGMQAFKEKCATLKGDGASFLEFLDNLAPAKYELDTVAWHGKIWNACWGTEPSWTQPTQKQPQESSVPDHDPQVARHQVQWMPILAFLRSMGVSNLSFGELLLGMRMCTTVEEQLEYIDGFRPEGISLTEWAESLHQFLALSHLLSEATAEAPTLVGEKGVLSSALCHATFAGCEEPSEAAVGHCLPAYITKPSLKASIAGNVTTFFEGGLSGQLLHAVAVSLEEAASNLISASERQHSARSRHVSDITGAHAGQQPGRPAMFPRSQQITPLNHLCPEFHLSTPEASLSHLSVSTGKKGSLAKQVNAQLRRLSRLASSVLHKIGSYGSSRSLYSALPKPPSSRLASLYDRCVVRTPIWWVRDTSGRLPCGLRELCTDLPVPCYLMPHKPQPSLASLVHTPDSSCLGYPDYPTVVGSSRGTVDVMQALQPVGPYVLAGFGPACYEAARLAGELQGHGLDVRLITVRDTVTHDPSLFPATDIAASLHELLELAHHLGVSKDRVDGILNYVSVDTLQELSTRLVALHPPGADLKTWSAAVNGLLGSMASQELFEAKDVDNAWPMPITPTASVVHQPQSEVSVLKPWDITASPSLSEARRCLYLPVNPAWGAALIPEVRKTVARFLTDCVGAIALEGWQE